MTTMVINETEQATPEIATAPEAPLQEMVRDYVERYLETLGDNEPKNLYNFVWREVERPLIEMTLQRSGNNQCTTARWLGIARGTLRTRMKEYNMLKQRQSEEA